MVVWAVLAGLLLWLYLPHLVSMAANWWNDPNYSHGFLIPLVSAGLIWRQRDQLAALPCAPNPLGLLVVALGLLILLVGQMGHEFFLRRLSLLPVLWGLVLAAWGWGVAKRVAFPFAYLLLMIPLPYVVYDSVAFPLRLVAASLAGSGLRLVGYSVLVEGNIVHLPAVTMDVVDACSGIRSLVSLLAVGVILAYLWLPKRYMQVILVLLVLPVAVLTNSFRVMLAGILAQNFGPEMLEGATHDFTGWVVFMTAFLLLAGLGWLLKLLGGGGGAQAAGTAARDHDPVPASSVQAAAPGRRTGWLWAVVVMLALTAGLIQLSKEVQPRQLAAPLTQLPLALAEWRAKGADQFLDSRTLDLLKPQDYLVRNYLDGRSRVGAVFAAYFGMQQEGQMIHSPRNCLPGGGWQIRSREMVEVKGEGGPWLVNHLVIGQDLDRLSVLYWYQGRGRVEPNEYVDRLRLITDGILHQRSDGALVRLTSVDNPQDQDLLPAQLRMAGELIPALQKLLPPSNSN
jgi:exosortase D (VPLPA-CTERM-specific)